MRSLLAKDPHPEANISTSVQLDQEIHQLSNSSGETEELVDTSSEKTPINSDVLQLVASFQKMRTEEQRLLELKQQILTRQHDLQDKLLKEMEKMKLTITNLTSEIPELQNKTKKLGEALGIDSYTKDQVPKTNPPKETLPECVGLLKCPKPEKCDSHESCLKSYVAAEIRNEIPKL